MEFKKYEDPKEFVRENEELILEKEWLNNLMVGNLDDAVNNGIDENWLLARVTDNERTELIILLENMSLLRYFQSLF
jgi:phosphoglycolate phosphatase-like HAD superfamily hydrolase